MTKKNWTDEQLFERLLKNKSTRAYWDNIGILRSRPGKNVYDKCVHLLRSDNPKAKEIAVNVLSQLGTTPRPFYKDTIKLFFELLKTEKEATIISALLYGIGHNNDNLSRSQIKVVCSFQINPDLIIKEALVFSLLGVNDREAINMLIKLSADKSTNIRNWATFGLGSQTETDSSAIREALWNRVNDKHDETKLEAILGLSLRKDKGIVDVIKKEIEQGEYSTLLFEAIVSFPDKQYLPLLKSNLKKDKTNNKINPEWIIDLENCITQIEDSIA